MVRSAFLNHLVGHLNLAGRYREAATFVEKEIRIAREYGLDFAFPHALTLRGMAFTGMRRFADAHADFNRVERLATESGDTFSVGNVGVQRVRLLLCRSEPRAACELAESLGSMPTRGTAGELISAHALSAAATGNAHLAEKLLENFEDVTNAVEAEQFVEWTHVILALQKHTERGRESVRSTLTRSLRGGCVHAFVCAYRAVPAILDTPGLIDCHCEDLAQIFERANDETLAARTGLMLDKDRSGQLSKRETEVLRLLAEGLPNRAIAERLFISEVTVKAHVRRIFEKLSVHTRTEAALVGARTLASDGEI
jgi:ATP/maltotriose-dependent transcriptional regulator MalT